MMFCHECGERLVEGAKFCGNCGTKLAAAAQPPREEVPAAAPVAHVAPDSSSDEVKVLDAGDKYVLSGTRSAAVDGILQKFLKRGAKLITPVSSVGKGWAAACTVPPAARNMDETQTLSLLDITKVAANSRPEEPEDGCRVEEFGFKQIVYGPSRLAVQRRLDYLKNFGARLVGEIEQQGEEWVAVVDSSSAQDGFRW